MLLGEDRAAAMAHVAGESCMRQDCCGTLPVSAQQPLPTAFWGAGTIVTVSVLKLGKHDEFMGPVHGGVRF